MENKDRRLTAMHPSLNAIQLGGVWTALNGWQIASATCLFHETQIDLSGYAMDSLTFFATGVGLQDPGIYTYDALIDPSFPFKALQVLDIVTSVPMDVAAVSALQNQFNTGPGMLGSKYEFETIIFGTYRFFTPNTNILYPNYMQLERSQRFDSGNPTAADKLYSYRILGLIQQDIVDGNYITIPAARHILAGVMGEEPELVYMQRLKRSYELANQV